MRAVRLFSLLLSLSLSDDFPHHVLSVQLGFRPPLCTKGSDVRVHRVLNVKLGVICHCVKAHTNKCAAGVAAIRYQEVVSVCRCGFKLHSGAESSGEAPLSHADSSYPPEGRAAIIQMWPTDWEQIYLSICHLSIHLSISLSIYRHWYLWNGAPPTVVLACRGWLAGLHRDMGCVGEGQDYWMWHHVRVMEMVIVWSTGDALHLVCSQSCHGDQGQWPNNSDSG